MSPLAATLAAAIGAIAASTAAAVEPAVDDPSPPGRLSLSVGAGWEPARLEGYDASGAAGSLGLQVVSAGRTDGPRLRVAWRLMGRRGETPKGLAVTAVRAATLVGLEQGRLGLAAGLELSSLRVERAGPGAMVGVDLGLRLAASADLLRFERGAAFLEVSGAVAVPTRERSAAFLLGARFDLR